MVAGIIESLGHQFALVDDLGQPDFPAAGYDFEQVVRVFRL